ncbi:MULTISPECIES: TIGR03943 family protein [unclassified Streptomyces]|uniref:TIGR03943 family putative permease subunit n=1 Tax=unclassified Streptomyces TaxID=2593676 RepID=UPI0023673F5B|nr:MULTISPECIES: TIGR03943 family protein [unclassified Streptomyces]MDF3142344.1 TIGR03943 family protein [Streptomyces sp. T21Q-yed]WDF40112.1 TIGR03943 family protein [Streptomyces sp. T12]
MNRQAQAAVLFLLGASLLHAATTDLYLRYVKQGLRPLVLVSGAVLIAAATATVWYERKRTRAQKQRAADQDAHAHREPRVAWLLVLPLFALILVAPPALGSYSATRAGTALQEPLAYPSLPAADPLPLSVVDYAGRAVYDHGRTLHDRRVQLTGFLALDRDGTPYLVRMALNCCAADAQPVKVALTGRIPPVLQPDTWLRITGTYSPRRTKDPVNGGPIPFIEVTEAKPVAEPTDPYDESWNN